MKDKVSFCILSWLRTQCISQAALELEVVLLSRGQEQLLKAYRELVFLFWGLPQKLIPVLTGMIGRKGGGET